MDSYHFHHSHNMVCCIICDCHDVYSPIGDQSTLYRCNDESINKNLIDVIGRRFDENSCANHYFQGVLKLNLATTYMKRSAMACVVCHNAPMLCFCALCGDDFQKCLGGLIMLFEYQTLISPCHILIGVNQCCIISFYLLNCLGFFKPVQVRIVPTNQPDINIPLEPPVGPPELFNMER